MPYYRYTAKNEHSETVKGKVEGQNEQQALQALRNRGLLVVTLKAESEDTLKQLSSSLFGVNNTDVVNFTRQLSTMVTAGLSLTEGISILEQQSKPQVAKLLGELLKDIEGGQSFANSLAKHPKVFSNVYIQLVKAGEAAGVLDQILERLADNLEKQKEFRGKAKGALIYPVIVIIAMIAVAAIMMIFVIPKLTEMYLDFGAELPLATQVLIGISNFFVNFWWVLVLLIVGGGFGLRAWWQTDNGKRAISAFSLKIPLYGILRKKIILTEFSRTLSLLLSAGISMLQALTISAEAASSLLYQEELKAATKKVEKGVGLAQTLSNQALFPPILSQMIAVGEQTGKLDEVLLKISIYFQTESE
ncbi:MAG TPA: type II secretion system F family protein, partial [Patescibacteria group bacterium]